MTVGSFIKALLAIHVGLWITVIAYADDSPRKTIKVPTDKGMLVGFFPPVNQEEFDDPMSGASEGIAHVRFALEDTKKCLEASGINVVVELVLANEIEFESTSEKIQVEIPKEWPKSVGIYMLRPNLKPEVVYAQAGPSSLTVLAPETARKYFGATACKGY